MTTRLPYDTTMAARIPCDSCHSVKCECPTGTDPYGHIAYALSDAKGLGDLICWDYAINDRKTLVRIHSVVNSESGHFIEDFQNVVVPIEDAMVTITQQIDDAVEWFQGEPYTGIRSVRKLLRDLARDLNLAVPHVHLRSH